MERERDTHKYIMYVPIRFYHRAQPWKLSVLNYHWLNIPLIDMLPYT